MKLDLRRLEIIIVLDGERFRKPDIAFGLLSMDEIVFTYKKISYNTFINLRCPSVEPIKTIICESLTKEILLPTF